LNVGGEDDEDEEPKEAKGGKGGGKGRPFDEPSEKQLSFLKSLRERIGMSDEKLGDLIAQVTDDKDLRTTTELSRRQTSEVIDELMIRAKEAGVDLESSPKATEKQVGFILSLKRRAHLTDVEFKALLEEVAGVKDTAEVTRKHASELIDKLQAMAAKGGGAAPAKGGSKKSAPAKKSAPPKKAAPRDEDEGGSADDERPPEKGPPPEIDDDDVPF
jgi:hypothetical protein